MKKKFIFIVPALFGIFLSACNSTSSESSISSSTPSSSDTSISTDTSSNATTNSTSDTQEDKQDFVGVSFENATFIYDGKPHILPEVVGAPENTNIVYTGRKEYIDVGSYNATVVLTKDGYNSKTLTATLTINKASFSGYTYESKTISYDGNDHINDIQLVGVLPTGTTKNEIVKDSNGKVVTSAIEVGTYTYTCVLTNKNYISETLTATLKIKAKKKDMPVFVSKEGTIYFANGLHNSYLYSMNNEGLKLIDYSSPKEFDRDDETTALFIANSILFSSVKQVNSGSVDILYTDNVISDFAKESDNIYYYSSNALTAEKSAIYKVDTTDKNSEPIITKLFEGKTDNLTLYNNNIYFTNGNDNNYIYKYDLSSKKSSLVMNQKVHEFIISDKKLYCTVNGVLNDFIGVLDLTKSSTQPTKLTDAAGEFLTIKNNYLYYNYTDLFSYIDSSLKGIWRISVNGGTPEQILATENVNGFDVESSSTLIYNNTNDLHLYRYNISNKTSVDLLNGFVAPETTPINKGGQISSLGNKTYYLNMYAGKTLYVYDELTKKSSQLTTNKVEDFYIFNDTMYFNQVTMFTNNDLYAVDLIHGGEAIKISSNDVRNMISDGEYIYGTHYNWAGLAGGIARLKLDGSEYVKFSDVNGAKNLTIKNQKLYYINCATGQDNGYIEYIDLTSVGPTSEKIEGTILSKNIKNVKQFIFDNDNIYYIYNGIIDNSIKRTSFASLNEGISIASSKTNPNEILLSGDDIYYYSYAVTASSNAGFFKVNKNANKDGTQEMIKGYDEKYYGSNLTLSSSGYLYFFNYISKLILGDAHIYQLNLNNKAVIKIN